MLKYNVSIIKKNLIKYSINYKLKFNNISSLSNRIKILLINIAILPS